jgi:pimeloyl-ACP methyl ester carboxylesterase
MALWVADDGACLATERVGAGRPVVLVHGGFTDSSGLEELATKLSTRRTVVRYDRRGRPDSAPYAAGHELLRDIRDLSGIVAALSEELGDVVIVGHSAGCHVALGAALSTPGIRGLLLYEPPTFNRPSIEEATRTELDQAAAAGDRAALVSIALNQVIGAATGMHIPPQVMPTVLESPFGQRLLRNALAIPVEQRAYEAHSWTDDELQSLAVPTTALVGGNSPPFNRLFIDRLAALTAAVTVHEVADADHGTPESDPGRITDWILEL